MQISLVSFLVSSILVFSSSWAANVPKESLLSDQPKNVVVNEIIQLSPKKNYHFNVNAPQKCGNFPALKKTAYSISCQFVKPGVQEFLVNICDADETFCKPEKHKVTVNAPKGYKPKKRRYLSDMIYVPKGERPAPRGWLQNNSQAAKNKAKRKKQLMLIDFYAAWCPPCNMYDEFVFEDKAFVEGTKDIVKLKLDADSDISWEWKEHFRVGGYPTIIIANQELEEVGRMVGYSNTKKFLSWINEQKAQTESMVQAETKLKTYFKNQGKYKPDPTEKSEMEKRKIRVGVWYFERGEYEKATSYLEGIDEPKAVKYMSLSAVQLARKSDNKDDMIQAYKRLVEQYPGDIEFLSWVYALAGLDKKGAKALLPLVKSNIEKWESKASLDDYQYNLGDLRQYEAHFYEDIGLKEKAQEKYLQAAAFYSEMASRSKLKVARGANLEKAYCLLKAGKAEDAKALYATMAKRYRGEFAFNYNYAWALSELKEYKQALRYANSAYLNAYGDNLLRATRMKAKIEMKLNRKKSAVKTIKKTLKSIYMPASTQIRTHRYLTDLRNLLKEIR